MFNIISTSTLFTYNDERSEDFDIILGEINTNKSYQYGLNYTPQIEKINGIDNLFYYGINREPLKFTLNMFKETYWTVENRMDIAEWLFQGNFKDLIFADDESGESYTDIVYSCMPIGEINSFDYGRLYGISVPFLCSLPYPTTNTTVREFDLYDNDTTVTISINNLSNLNDYFYNIDLEFELKSDSTGISLENLTDGGRTFTFTGLDTLEVISVQNQRKEIISSTGENRLSNFNKNWFRLLTGYNSIKVTGKCYLDIQAKFPIII